MDGQEQVAIRVSNITKSFILPHEKQSSIKGLFINMFRGRRTYEKQQVLKNLSLEIKEGEFVGIVGRNGSGKSTLLKLMAGIYSPDSGSIQVNGKLTPFIELGVGFNPELTGRENVFLNGALLGFNRKEMQSMYDEIVEFAELEKFMDQKLKNYSSGMQVRLAFSIAIRVQSDILVLDEVLAVGDEAFQRKCYQYFAELRKQRKTVILVTHSMESVQRFCTKAILIDKGHKTETGTPAEITQIYRDLNKAEDTKVRKRKEVTVNKYVKVRIRHTRSDGKMNLNISVVPEIVLDDPVISFAIYEDSGKELYRWVSDQVDINGTDLNKKIELNIVVQDLFPVGKYYASLFVKNRMRTIDYANFVRIIEFEKDLPRGASVHQQYWQLEESYSIRNLE